ncbi:PHD finger protein [Vitis vinifera]|uniref:PHD finger protein n=1 Tax=Vitis vinifera TaxID=29760 RepID=A0A438H5Y0_VITVI|nr:PHD finger protein [Vitis vinifera]
MEESKEFVAHSATYSSQRLQSTFGSPTESRGPQHTARMFPSDKPGHPPISSGELKEHISDWMEGQMGLLIHLKYKQQTLLLITFRQKTPTWSLQPQSVSSVKTGPENKVQDHIAARVEGAADISSSRMAPQSTRDQNSRSFVTHTTPGHLQSTQQLLLGNNFQPSSLSSNHNEIGKIVQKLLHPQLPQHPTWNPPSRDYMNKAVTCQICKLTINEWEAFAPKYGRVMRNMNTPKGPISAAGVQPSSEKKVGILDQQKITENGNSDLQGHNGSLVNNHIELASDSKTLNASQVQVNNSSSSIKNVDDKPSSGTYPNNSIKSLGAACGSLSIASSNETSTQHRAKEPTGFSPDGLHDVQWIGDVLRVVEEKTFYQSCCINGDILYGKCFLPFLQGMWEDSKTRSKWVMANQCYFPSDLPEVVGRRVLRKAMSIALPLFTCHLVNIVDVYESNHDSAITAGLIQGPCEVLPPDKFKEESERRTLLGTEANDGLWPIFLCKYVLSPLIFDPNTLLILTIALTE